MNATDLQERLSFLYKELENLEEHQQELKQTIKAIDELKEGEILTPLATGIFMKAKIESTEFIINVGSNVAVKKSAQDAKSLLYVQLEELDKIGHQIAGKLQEGMSQLEELEKNV